MKYEVQVHFKNGGSIGWDEEHIAEENIREWLHSLSKEKYTIEKDTTTGKFMLLNMEEVIGVLVSRKQVQDIFERAYAVEEGKVEKGDFGKYS